MWTGSTLSREVLVGQGRPRGERRRDGFGRRRGERREVPHLPAGTRARFAVHMQLHAWKGTGALPPGLASCPEIPEKVRHRRRRELRRRAEWKAAHGAQLLLELAGDRRIERVVARVVGPRGELVDEKTPVTREEELDTEH